FNSLGAGVGGALAEAVRCNSSLIRLNLRSNGLGHAGGMALAKGIASNRGCLKELIVADNKLGPAAATAVAAGMRGGTVKCLQGFGSLRAGSRGGGGVAGGGAG
ncbi:unnamed protein product, partial [Discosporangium mesarthrocarpum]